MKTLKESTLLATALTALCCLQGAYAAGPQHCNGVTVICLKKAPARLGRPGATYVVTQDVMSNGSQKLFTKQFPSHPWTTELNRITDSILELNSKTA